MKRPVVISLAVAASLLFVGLVVVMCLRPNREKARLLAQAEQLIESQPDSSLVILERLDSVSGTASTRALHALLLTQARVKCDVPIGNDSLINIAVDYYRENGPDSLLMHAAFYLGNVRKMLRDHKGAIGPTILAYNLSVKTSDDYWRAKSAELLGLLYGQYYFRDEAQRFSGEAALFYGRVGRKTNQLFSLCDNAMDRACNNRNYEAGLKLLDSIYEAVMADDWVGLQRCYWGNKFDIQVWAGKYEEAEKTYVNYEALVK